MLAGRVHPVVQQAIGALVRSMNCGCSNLIEGMTRTRGIPTKHRSKIFRRNPARVLQLEALAHIGVQQRIDL
jgi:hypothetical protein